MERNQFARFADALKRLGADGVGAQEFVLGSDRGYELQYIPFEHVNRQAKLVIVGITPGNTQLSLAYGRAQELLRQGRPESEILVEIKKAGAFGGPSMKPNLLKMLRHFNFERLLHIEDVETLWSSNAHLLHSTSVVPHAAFKAGKMFAGSFQEILDSPLLASCFKDCFVPSAREMPADALFVGLGPCPQAALEWCVKVGVLHRRQVLGAFCHPSNSGGSTTRYYLRDVTREEMDPKNPVISRCDWLDEAYEQMRRATAALLGGYSPSKTAAPKFIPVAAAPKTTVKTAVHEKVAVPKTKVAETATSGTGDVFRLISEIKKAGYKPTKETAKLAEFESPAGQVIYLVKTTSKLNSVSVMVHPGLKPEALRRLDGVGAIKAEHRFHSNMTRYPKRINSGKTETAYGWEVNIDTEANLPRFLAAFSRISF